MASSSAYNFSKKILSPTTDHHRHPEIDKIDEKQVSRNQMGDSGLVQREMVSRDRDSKQLNDKIYSSKARLPSALAGFGRKGGSRRVKGREEGKGWLEETSAVHSLSYRTFTLQSCVVIYGCRSLIRRIRTPLSPHVCCPSIDPIYRDETGVHEVSRPPCPPILVDDSSRGVNSRGKRKLIEQRATDRDL